MLGIDHLHGRQVADARSVCTGQLAPDRGLAHSGPLEVVCTGLPLRSPTRELEVKKGFYGGGTLTECPDHTFLTGQVMVGSQASGIELFMRFIFAISKPCQFFLCIGP